MKCSKCERKWPKGSNAKAAIAIFVMGDEYIYRYWYCDVCDLYTVESYHDRFMGEDEVSVLPQVSRELGDHCVELIEKCPSPQDKKCDCASHEALYYGLPRN